MNIASNQTLYLLSLLNLKGVGPAAIKRAALIPGFEGKTIGEVASNVPQIARSLEGGASWDEAREWAEKQVQAAQKHSAYILSAVDPEYPPLLAATKDDPFILYVQGKLAKPEQRSVAVIGTREPTYHGALVANRITTHFGEAGWSIVSGLAIGCDGLAHQAALACGAHTVAVMAHGLHMTAPSKHKKLAQDILASGGAVVSEYPFGQAVQSQQYVKRDRTQAGMALGVVMIQSDIKGGSLYASRATLEYGRWLAVPYPTDKDRERKEPKIQANLVIAEGVPHEKADLLRCTTSALERVIVLRSKEDYWRLADSNGVEPFTSIPSVAHRSPDVEVSTGNARSDFFDSFSNASVDEPAAMQLDGAPGQPPNAEPGAIADEAAARAVESESSERAPAGEPPLQAEQSPDLIEPCGRSLNDAPPVELEFPQQDTSAELIAGALSVESHATDAPDAHIDGAIDPATVEAIAPAITEEFRHVLLEVKLPDGDALGAAFGLWQLPKRGGKESRKRLGNAVDDRRVRDFYARHGHLQTRLTELERKLRAATPPLRHDQVLALRLVSEEVVFHVSKLAIASATIEALSREERRRVEEEDWIEKGASDKQPSQSGTCGTSEMRQSLVATASALLKADPQSFVIDGVASEVIESSSEIGASRLSLPLLVERLNSVLMSAY